jgi:hypothetical protein
MILELRSGADSGQPWVLRLTLDSPWRPLEAVTDELNPAFVESLRDVGIDLHHAEAEPHILGVAVLIDRALVETEPPLVASLTVIELDSPPELLRIKDGSQEPVVRRDEVDLDWPAGVGAVRIHRVTYIVATPDDQRALALMFATPNIPLTDAMDVLFDSIVAGAQFFSEQAPVPA